MSRLKLYYPLDEITRNLYTSGQQWMTTDNKEYIGLYHSYTTGEVFTHPDWDSFISQPLIPYKEQTAETKKNIVYETLKGDLKLKREQPVSAPVQLTKDNIYAGSIERYFIKKYNEANIIEINKNQFELWQSDVIDFKLYNAVKLTWYISGNIEDVKINGISVPGVISNNRKQISLAATKLPELQSYLTNYTEYYSDNTFIIPTDINGLDS